MIFKRKIYDKMLKWKQEFNGNTALLIKGARRIGKSTIVEEFAKNEYESYINIDFSIASQEIKKLFLDLSDLDLFFAKLQLLMNTTLIERKSVVIFDEVQLYPLARQAIKHLVKDGRYDYIETGSLLSIKKNIKDILIPSEETRINMYPMDYEEFMWAFGKDINMTEKFFKEQKKLGDDINRKLMMDFRVYMLVGGMPQAVLEYIKTNNFMKVDNIKRNILELYLEDFRKIDPSGRASLIFSNIPAQLNKKSSRYNVSSVLPNYRAQDIENIIEDMKDSMTINICYNIDNPDIGMNFTKDINKYKMFLSDTGLFVTLAFMDKDFTENEIYKKFISNKLSTNLGYVYENALAQILKANGNELFYHTMRSKTSNHSYEVDFIISKQNKICPIEVKSSNYIRHASLDYFIEKYSKKILNKYLVYTKDFKKENNILMIPIYMAMFI
ncbi:ATP-binding protein [Oceanivirga salmonicida]|uniref:ATP-binding protein n=1 Tax=Oceanivirga salmonicida TaxID=1769291 RepID=UPI000ACA1921|nr:AAA family ATPase [Oceanivirga salmonicida]